MQLRDDQIDTWLCAMLLTDADREAHKADRTRNRIWSLDRTAGIKPEGSVQCDQRFLFLDNGDCHEKEVRIDQAD